jgi:hypothetical protein
MKVSELRIGNLVSMGEYLIQQLSPYNIYQLSLMEAGTNVADYYKQIKPIPLTEKRLINFGFELKQDEGDVKYYEQNAIGIKMDDCLDFYLYVKSYNSNSYFFIKQLEVVHELQNLYFALTGEELILKP